MATRDLIISIHVPKTAGTAFADVLERNYGEAVGFYYGAEHPKTHPKLRGLGRRVDADDLDAVAAAGIRVIHGHFPAKRFLSALPDPSRYWIWLRDPIERVISEYAFNRGRSDVAHPLAKSLQENGLSLVDYAKQKRAGNLQARTVRPLEIADFGFVGLTEFYDASLALTGLDPAPAGDRVRNATSGKEPATRRERKVIARRNLADVALYSAALQRVAADLRGKAG